MAGVRLGRLGRRPIAAPRLVLPVLLICLLLSFLAAERSVAPVIRAVAEQEARALATGAVNRVVTAEVAGGLADRELVRYITDREGRITALHADTLEINRVAARVGEAVQAEFRRMAGSRFRLPLGQLTGSRLLAALGPHLPVTFTPVGAVLVTIRQDFAEAGINQTRHLVILETEAHMRMVVPLVSHEIRFVHELPLIESVLIGPVPSTYWKADLGGWWGAGAWPPPTGLAP